MDIHYNAHCSQTTMLCSIIWHKYLLHAPLGLEFKSSLKILASRVNICEVLTISMTDCFDYFANSIILSREKK